MTATQPRGRQVRKVSLASDGIPASRVAAEWTRAAPSRRTPRPQPVRRALLADR